ncbi:MAG TPA: carotenoid oxygenase family protein [Iamia sp.]|nr:carotenoid oxygenase family protein [Iamia sp.]
MDIELVGRALRTLPDDDDHPYRSGPWRPQHEEWHVDTLDLVAGELPEDLDGLYLRNTENPVHLPIERYHPFDGDGMVHAVGFQDGRAWYRNRFIRTAGFEAEQEVGRSLWAGISESPKVAEAPGGWGARTRMKDASSTDIVVHAGEALTSFWQCGDLYRLDPLTLDTIGATSWDGWFPAAGVSAHTKVDEATGEMFFFSYGLEAPYLHFGVVDADNRLVHHTPVPLPGPRLPHDMAFTENHVILNAFPMYWDQRLLEKGHFALAMHDEPSRFAVLPRRGTEADIVWFEADPTYVLHFTNAYEDGDEIVLEGFYQESPMPKPDVSDEMWMFRYLALDWMKTRLHRWRFDLKTGKTHEEHIRDDYTEFGIINPAVAGKPHRYVHAATGKPGWFLFDGLVRHDVQTGVDQHLRLPEGVYCSEVGVAPKVGGTAEDDAYLVTLTTDAAHDTSECWVIDAADVSAGPVAKLRLPQRISSGTHATWAPGAAVPGW